MKLDDLVRTLPKAELHVHLEGAIAPTTALKLAHKYPHLGLVDRVEALQEMVGFQSFEDFHSNYCPTEKKCINCGISFLYS